MSSHILSPTDPTPVPEPGAGGLLRDNDLANFDLLNQLVVTRGGRP